MSSTPLLRPLAMRVGAAVTALVRRGVRSGSTLPSIRSPILCRPSAGRTVRINPTNLPLSLHAHHLSSTAASSVQTTAPSSPPSSPSPPSPHWKRAGLAAAVALAVLATASADDESAPFLFSTAHCTTGVTTRKWRQHQPLPAALPLLSLTFPPSLTLPLSALPSPLCLLQTTTAAPPR